MFYRLGIGEYLVFKDFDYSVLESKIIYFIVRCYNCVGLFFLKLFDGVKIFILLLLIINVKVKIILLLIIEYKVGNNY